MSDEFLQHLDLPKKQVTDVLDRLAQQKKIRALKQDASLLGYLETLRIIHRSGQTCYLDNPERLEQLLSKIGFTELKSKNKRRAILRKTEIIHHKCAAAWRGDSKSGHSGPLFPDQQTSSDEAMRVRSHNTGLSITYDNGWLQSIDNETDQRTECVVPERLWLKRKSLDFNNISLILTVENLGAFVDLPLVDGLLLIYVPGLNLAHIALLQALPKHVPWVAFPDYDPNGISIVHTMAKRLERPARIWLPVYWHDQAAQRSREMLGASKRKWCDAPALDLPGLRDINRWLEQETLVLDHRCDKALLDLVNKEIGIAKLTT